ncbi:hypothetical protein, partial [Dethiosulfovibrio salsuginis]
WSGITGWFGDLWGGVKGTWTGLWDSLPNGSSIMEGLKGVWEGLPSFFNGLLDKVKAAFGSVWGWIEGKVDWLRGAVGKIMSVFGNNNKQETPEEKAHRESRESEAKTYAQNTLGVAMEGIDLTGNGLSFPSASPPPSADAVATISRAEQIVNNTTKSVAVTQHNSIAIHSVAGQSPEEIAEEVIRRLEEKENRGGVLYDRAGF